MFNLVFMVLATCSPENLMPGIEDVPYEQLTPELRLQMYYTYPDKCFEYNWYPSSYWDSLEATIELKEFGGSVEHVDSPEDSIRLPLELLLNLRKNGLEVVRNSRTHILGTHLYSTL